MLDTTFRYTLPGTTEEKQCRLQIAQRREQTVIIVSPLVVKEDIQNSLTDGELVTQVCNTYNLDPEKVVWIERNRNPERPWFGGDPREEFFDQARLDWDKEGVHILEWTPLSRDDVQELLGEPLPE